MLIFLQGIKSLLKMVTKKKLVIVGDGNVGKSCILRRIVDGVFDEEESEPTILEHYSKIIDHNGLRFELDLMDTAGQESFGTVRRLAYSNVDIVLMVFSTADSVDYSFSNVKSLWMKEIQEYISEEELRNVTFILVGSKFDLAKDQIEEKTWYTEAKASQLRRDIDAKFYFECSAKTGEGIDEIIEAIGNVSSQNLKKNVLRKNWKEKFMRKTALPSLLENLDTGKAKKENDRKLAMKLKSKKDANYFSDDLLFKFFKNDYHETLNQILKVEAIKIKQFLSQRKRNHVELLTGITNENLMLELLQLDDVNIDVLQENKGKKGNLIHHFIEYDMRTAIDLIIEKFDVTNLFFQLNSSKNTPLMKAVLTAGLRSDLPIRLWHYLTTKVSYSVFAHDVISKLNGEGLNLLHLCAVHGQLELLVEILKFSSEQEELRQIVISSFNLPSREQRRILDQIQDEKILLQCIDLLKENINLIYMDHYGNNILHRLAYNDFDNAIRKCEELLDNETFTEMMFARNKNGNTPLHDAAINNKGASLSCLMFKIGAMKDQDDLIKELLHQTNNNNDTLLSLILQQEGSLFAPQGFLLDFEKRFHQNEMELIQCFRSNLPSSSMTNRALNTVLETYDQDVYSTTLIYLQHIILNLLVPIGFWIFDVVTDMLLTRQYQSGQCSSNVTANQMVSFENVTKIPVSVYDMTCRQKFSYSLFFIILPWTYYLIELILSRKLVSSFEQIKEHIERSERWCTTLEVLRLMSYFFIWPLVIFAERFWTGLQVALKKGADKVDLSSKSERNLSLTLRAQMIEAASESSFQPLLQLFLLLPQIISLSHSFTNCHVVGKRGALDWTVNPVGRILLMFSIIIQIVSRMTAFVLLGYFMSYNNLGVFWPLILFVLAHILIMAVLHFVFSEEREISLDIMYNCLINGFCNIYVHNSVSLVGFNCDHDRNSVYTFWRQVVFDSIFLLENTIFIILFNSINADIPKVIFMVGIGFPLGLLFKLTYYKFFHLWKNSRNIMENFSCKVPTSSGDI